MLLYFWSTRYKRHLQDASSFGHVSYGWAFSNQCHYFFSKNKDILDKTPQHPTDLRWKQGIHTFVVVSTSLSCLPSPWQSLFPASMMRATALFFQRKCHNRLCFFSGRRELLLAGVFQTTNSIHLEANCHLMCRIVRPKRVAKHGAKLHGEEREREKITLYHGLQFVWGISHIVLEGL